MNTTTAISTTRRERSEQARARAIIRFNGLLFHSLAAASFLEAAVPADATRLGDVVAARPEVGHWLEQVGWPRRAMRGRRLRAYVEATWPEFDWSAAYQDYLECRRPRKERGMGIALGALGSHHLTRGVRGRTRALAVTLVVLIAGQALVNGAFLVELERIFAAPP